MAKIVAVFVLALIAVAMAAPAEEKKQDLQTAQGIGLGYYGLGGYGLGYGGLYGGYGLGLGYGLGYGGLLHRGLYGFYG